jgi:diguanylate cyclase (GGDEF)-like protein
MPNPHLSILVVDDAKFSSAMIGRTLSLAGYQDLRFASSAAEAIKLLDEHPASVLLADWLMPEMNGLELTVQVRQFDEMSHHYTYVILLIGKEGDSVLSEAFDSGVDDFISKAAMNEQLVPRENVVSLEKRNLIDPLTGLGNSRYLHQKMLDSLHQVESRGGALCYLLIGLQDMPALPQHNGETFYSDLLQNVARRLQQLVRPLDVLVRLDDNHFALITLLSDLHECAPSSFKRLHEGLNLKAFKTSEGFISLKASISLVGLDARGLPCTPEQIIEHAERLLPESHSSGRVTALRLPLAN